AFDSYGNVATGYLETVHFTSSDAFAALPPDHTFLGTDLGVTTVSGLVLETAGAQSVSASDAATPSMIGTQSGIQVSAGSAASLTVAGFPSPTAAGAAGAVTVTARDAFGNVAPTYLGTVTFSSSDPLAALPNTTAFTSA